ncbi:S8 family peptidase [Georgenia yuyongxinii]|uniref:S8 family serine peptidase n=1 Tax=Georgenia yuyongxinii TaxID=2589797 RepID=A0A552WJJ3_9MICO|nr:S8 family serine peptidase [Georgenia yuyongxinii]TRW42907.1 S8 family serine peptidase [Georgenia yuyongxinii]
MPPEDPSVTTVRLLLRLGADGHAGAIPVPGPDAAAVRDLATRALGTLDEAGRPWRVEPLADGAGPLEACWVVSGAVPTLTAYDASRTAYDLAARLAVVTGADVEPDVPSSAFGPESWTAAGSSSASGEESFTDPAAHLPGSEPPTWAVDAVRARDAWALTPPGGGRSRGDGAVVASIDTGYTDHPEVARMYDLTKDWDAIAGDDDARDPLERPWYLPFTTPGHGTASSSVIGSRETRTILGVAPLCTVVPIRAVRSVVQVLDGDVARAVETARRRGCHVISMSLGGRGFFGLQEAIRAAVADGMVVMAAAGNKVGVVVAPASYPECLAVAATNADSRPWQGSSHGPLVDISAPGESVWVAAVDRTSGSPTYLERRASGTSYAVACLAGVAALWIAHHGHEAIVARYGRAHVQAAFLALLRSHGHREPPGWDTWPGAGNYGVGIVDAAAQLEAGLPPLVEPEVASAGSAGDAVGRLQAVLADLDRDQVRTRVARLLGVSPADVDALPATAVSELVYRLGEEDALRAAVVGPEVAGREVAVAPDGRALLARTSSRALLAVPAAVPDHRPPPKEMP